MDLKRMFQDKKFYLAVLIALAGILLGASYPDPKEAGQSALASGTFLATAASGLKADAALFFLPVAAVLPMAEEFLRERQGNFIRFLSVRRTRQEYCRDKVLTTALSGMLVWLFAAALAVLFYFLLFFGFEEVFAGQEAQVLELVRVLLRVCLVSGAVSAFGAVCALLGMSVYVAFGLPFVAFYCCIILRERYLEELYCIDPSEWIRAECDWGENQMGLWLFLVLLAVFFSFLHGLLLARKLEEV